MSGETVSEALKRIHSEASPAMGQMALCIARGSLTLGALRAWTAAAERQARDLRELADRLDRR